jgi:hypothetical protein
VVDTPDRLNAALFALTVCEHEIGEAVECESDVFKAAAFLDFGLCPGDLCDGDAMVLFVVREKGEHFVLMDDAGAEECYVELNHGLHVVGPEDDVRELAGRLHRGPWVVEVDARHDGVKFEEYLVQ